MCEVDVPINNTAGLSSVQVFTGPAVSRSAALRIAHEVYVAARAATKARLAAPAIGRTAGERAATGLAGNLTGSPPRPAAGQPVQLDPRRRRRRLRAVDPPRDGRHRPGKHVDHPGQHALSLATAAFPLPHWTVHAIALLLQVQCHARRHLRRLNDTDRGAALTIVDPVTAGTIVCRAFVGSTSGDTSAH